MLRISILSSLTGHGQTPNPTLGEQSLLWSYHYYHYYYYYYTGWMHNQSKRKKTILCYFMYSMHHV